MWLSLSLGYRLTRSDSDSAESNLFAGILQASIRTNDDVSAALDWLFACQSCNRHCNLQVWVGDISKCDISMMPQHGILSADGDFILKAIKWRRSSTTDFDI